VRHLLALALTLIPAISIAQEMTDTDWQLLAIDGVVVGYDDIVATLRIGADGTMTGKAPCNSFSAANTGTLPALSLGGIRATRMACDKLKGEQAFFDALSAMVAARMDGSRNLILTGPEGRSMEFVTDRMNSLTVCKTCPPKE
jgi:heat shock protein HslJ